MQTDCSFSSQFLTIGDEGLKAFNMSVVGDTSDYQWKEFQGSVPVSWEVFQGLSCFDTSGNCAEMLVEPHGMILTVAMMRLVPVIEVVVV